MSLKTTEKITEKDLNSQSLNDDSNTVQIPLNDTEKSGSQSPKVEAMIKSKDISSDNSETEKSSRKNEPDDPVPDLVLKVSQVNISNDQAVNVEPTLSQGTSTSDQRSESLKNIRQNYRDLSDSSENEDNTNISFKGLMLGNEYEYVDDSEDDTETESDDYDSENGGEIQMKKRKVQQEESWLSVLGVDRVSTELPHISTLELNNKEEFLHMGDLECIIDKIVTIAGLPGMPAYDLDTLLFLEEGQKILGYVLDVMGPVTAPVYVVPMSSPEAIRDLQLGKGTKVYCAPKSKYTKYVLLQELMKMRGSDPSWTGDTPPEEEQPDPTEKGKKRDTSEERHAQFVRNMNKANERDTRLHRTHRTQCPVRQPRDCRSRNNHQETRRSRAIYRNSAARELQGWTVVDSGPASRQGGVQVVPAAFDPSVPPPNCAGLLAPEHDRVFSAYVGFVPQEFAGPDQFDFEARARRLNMPGTSNEGWFN